MQDYYVSPSYASLKKVGEVFEKNGKNYIKVVLKSGKEKEVRAYEPKEEKEEILTTAQSAHMTHVIYDVYKELGFAPKKFIYAVRGPEELYQYCKWDSRFGYYLGCQADILELPFGCTIKKIPWLAVCCDDNVTHLKEEKVVRAKVEDFFKRTKKEN